MPFIPSVLKKPRDARRGGMVDASAFRSRTRLVQTEPLFTASVGGDPKDKDVRLGAMPEIHRQALAALGDSYSLRLPNGTKIYRDATGGVGISVHVPPVGIDANDVFASGFVDPAPAGWWLGNGMPAPGTNGTPLPFTPKEPPNGHGK